MDAKNSLEVTRGTEKLENATVETRPVSDTDKASDLSFNIDKPFPTEEEFATLPRVPGAIPWTAWTVAAVEFAERFSYYGTTAVCEFERAIILRRTQKLTSISVVNFIQKDLPKGSTTGAGFLIKPGSGALGMGQRASTGLTTCELKLRCFLNETNHVQSTISGLMLHHYSVHTLLISTLDDISLFNMLSASHWLDTSF
jgi:POT family proton-dependent oligopeptide transporter